MPSLLKWTLPLVVLTMTACATNTNGLSASQVEDLHLAFKRAVCLNLVPISGKATDDEYTRIQVKRQNARVAACPPEWQRRIEP